MPFTPYHMGPGVLIKAVFQGSFSLMVFGWAQIIMDLQPLFVLVSGEGHLHGFSHTFLGATLLAIVATLSGKYLSELGLRILLQSTTQPLKISWPVAAVSAFLGCFSHVLLDSLMHADLQPFAPWSTANPWLHQISVAQLHQFCVYSGIVGSVFFFGLVGLRKLKTQNH